jgi:hypothetical protein
VGTTDFVVAVADCVTIGIATGILKFFNQPNEPQIIDTIIATIIILGNLEIVFG